MFIITTHPLLAQAFHKKGVKLLPSQAVYLIYTGQARAWINIYLIKSEIKDLTFTKQGVF